MDPAPWQGGLGRTTYHSLPLGRSHPTADPDPQRGVNGRIPRSSASRLVDGAERANFFAEVEELLQHQPNGLRGKCPSKWHLEVFDCKLRVMLRPVLVWPSSVAAIRDCPIPASFRLPSVETVAAQLIGLLRSLQSEASPPIQPSQQPAEHTWQKRI